MFNPSSLPNGGQGYDAATLNQPPYVDHTAPNGASRPGAALAFPGYSGPAPRQAGGRPGGLANGGGPPAGDSSQAQGSGGWPGQMHQQAQQPQQYGAPPQTSELLQNQLAQQAAMQSQQRQLFQQQQGGFSQPQPAHFPQPSQQFIGQPHHSHASQQSSSQSALPPPQGRNQNWAAIVAGLTQEKFNALPPNQQAALREMITRQKMAQQASLGHGYPGSPAGSGGGSPGMSGSPVAPPGGYSRPPQSTQQAPMGAPPQGQSQQNTMFMKAISEFHQKKGTPFAGPPVVEGRVLDMSRLYTLTMQSGGFMKCQQNPMAWRVILTQMGFAPDPSGNHSESRIVAISQAYHTSIFPFEQAFQQIAQSRQLHLQQQQQLQLQQQQLLAARANNGNGAPLPNQPAASANSPYQPSAGQSSQGPPPSMQQRGAPTGLQQMPMSGSPFASAQLNQGVPAGTPGLQSQQLPSGSQKEGEDRKGKGKSPYGASLMSKTDEGDPDLAPESASFSSTSFPPSSLPTSSSTPTLRPGSTESFKPHSAPVAPAPPPRRKRQRLEYVPLQRTLDTYASWDLGQVEDVVVAASQRKRPRTVHDLGSLDVHSLTMSLKSRLGSEVAYALNALTLISLTVRQSASDQQGLSFPLAACGELFDELLELLEETAFGVSDELDDEDDEDDDRESAEIPPSPLLSYRDLFRIVTQEETELADLPDPKRKSPTTRADDGLCPLEPIDTILSIFNLLRNFALADENFKLFSTKRKLLNVLVRVADLPLRRDGPRKGRWPVQVSAAHSMVLRKDAIETISHFALDIRLDKHSEETASALFKLLLFFVLDADHLDQLYFDLSTSPSASSRIPQATYTPMSHYLAVGLSAFARVTTPDANRYVFAALAPVELYSLFESLIHLLPITEADFQLVTSEAGLFFAETLVTTLYNIAFLAPAELKLRLRVIPGFIRSFLRVVKRLMGTTVNPSENAFVMLCDHCVATLTLLSEVGGISTAGQQTTGGLWFGLGPLADEDDRPSGLIPSDADRGMVTAKQPPKSGGHQAPSRRASKDNVSGLFDTSDAWLAVLGDHAQALVVESSRSIQTRSLLAYNTSTVRSVIRESHTLGEALSVAAEVYAGTAAAQPDRETTAQMTINAITLHRNLRALLVYHQQRIETLQEKFWENGGTLRAAFSEEDAPETRKHLATVDIAFVQKYNDLCVAFKESMYGELDDRGDTGVQLMQATQLLAGGTTMPPPRDVYVSVRVVGESQSLESKNGGGVLSLHKGSQYHVPFEDVEDLLVSGTLELIE
ncbi:SWI/SNF chromatin-remodeling complex subunit SWI1, partial [Phenoliferia sp. Uapishka_3]